MCREPENRGFVVGARVADIDLGEEAVELRFGQGIGAFVLDRVLCRDDDERIGERSAHPVDTHLAFLHCLEQRGLGLRRRAVDLVGQQQVGEHRTLAERGLARSQRHRPGEVGGQHVGRELHPPEVDADRARERVRDERLGHTRNAFEQQVAADGDRREQHLDDAVLTDDDLADLLHDPIAKFVHTGLLSSCDKRETS